MLGTEKSPSEGKKNYINCLPAEVLLLILEIFCPKSHGKDEYKSVLVLASVCQRWREAILNTPTFWTYIHLHPRHHQFKMYPKRTVIPSYPARLVLQLKRAKSAPLEIFWMVDDKPHPLLVDIIHSLAPLTRWRTLKLAYIPTGETFFEWGWGDEVYMATLPNLPRFTGRFENLKVLSIHSSHSCLSHLINLVETTALKLERLELQGRSADLVREELSNTSRRVSKLVIL